MFVFDHESKGVLGVVHTKSVQSFARQSKPYWIVLVVDIEEASRLLWKSEPMPWTRERTIPIAHAIVMKVPGGVSLLVEDLD